MLFEKITSHQKGIAPVLPYLPVYSYENLHISYEGIGFIYALLPFICFIARTSSGALADLLKVHRILFLASIVVCGLSLFSIGFIAPLPTKPNPNLAYIQFDCSSAHCVMRHSLAKQQCMTLKELNINDTATCEINCNFTPNSTTDLCTYWNISSGCSVEAADTFAFTVVTNLNYSLNGSTEVIFPISKLSFNETEINSPKIDDVPFRVNCTATCGSDPLMEFLGTPNHIPLSSYSELLYDLQFWTYLLLMCMAWSAISVWSVISDTICFKLLGSEKSKFGFQRLYGSISWGLIVILTGLLIDMTSSHSGNKNYTSAFILSLCILNIDFIVAIRLKVPGDNEKLKRSSITNLVYDSRIIVFMISCFVVGITSGVLWTYQLLLVEETVNAWDCDFKYMKLLQGLIMAMGSYGGEIPFFFLSGYFISKLGYVNSMSLVILMFGLRFIFYSLVWNPWWFLPIELLQGFTFSIFCSVMTSYASIIAPPGGEATVQGIVTAVQGLGVASGSYIGGALFSAVGGASTFGYVGAFNMFFALFHVLIHIVLDKIRTQTTMRSSMEGYAPPGESPNADIDAHRKEGSDNI